MLRFLTAGESHGLELIAILEGMVANLALSASDIDKELKRRQQGAGRSPRMKIESDHAEIISGLRNGKTMGSPIALLIPNRSTEAFNKPFTALRPGHADLAGSIKYGTDDARNILERASARETAARVAVGAICKKFLGELKIEVGSNIVHIGGFSEKKHILQAIERARLDGDSLGGEFEVVVNGAPIGLGSHVHWDRRLNGRLAQAVMSIPAIKGVEIGLGFVAAELRGSEVQDEIFYKETRKPRTETDRTLTEESRWTKFYHKTNNAGGIEGGISNGEPIVIRAAMKPIATIPKPLQSVDLKTRKPIKAHVERADVCAVEAAAVIGEAVVAFIIADAVLEKYGGDSLGEVKKRFER